MSANDANGRRRWRLSFLFVLAASTSVAIAGPREQAKRIHNRLTGTHPSPAVLSSMAAKITAGDALGAANEAINNPAFYNTTLKDLATPWSTKRQSIFVGLNDLSATVIGLIRDNRSFQEVLTADVLYVGAAGVVPTPYSHTDNTHYQELEANGVDLSNPANLVPVAQSTIPDTPLTPENTAGIMTSRTFAEAFFAGGTNRRATRFASINFLCGDMEAFRDITRPADRIRPDITRSPGGDSSIFLNDCISCHSGMDALTGAFAYYDFSKDLQRLVFTDNVAQAKNNKAGTTFPLGFITTDDSWVNYWRVGVNSGLGWNPVLPDRGKGAKSLGVEITSSRAFAECQVSQVLAKVCLREPTGAADSAAVQRIADVLQASGYNMKTDDDGNGVGKFPWIADNAQTSATFFLVYNPNGRPVPRRPTAQQIGYFRPTGNIETTSSPFANNVTQLAEMVVLNYMALHGEEGLFANVLPNAGLVAGNQFDPYIAFNQIV